MNRLIEISLELRQKYLAKADVQIGEWKLTQEDEAHKTFITPPDGWPGKNEEQRRVAAEKVFADDPALSGHKKELLNLRQKLITIDAEIQALDAERRALEWSIRNDLISRLSQAGVARDDQHEPADAVSDHQLDQATFMPGDEEPPF
jgi:hypothetical protein